VDAKDIFGEINVEKQTAVNTALRDNITISIKYRDETSELLCTVECCTLLSPSRRNTTLYKRRQT
jgi:hypothetical protein